MVEWLESCEVDGGVDDAAERQGARPGGERTSGPVVAARFRSRPRAAPGSRPRRPPRSSATGIGGAPAISSASPPTSPITRAPGTAATASAGPGDQHAARALAEQARLVARRPATAAPRCRPRCSTRPAPPPARPRPRRARVASAPARTAPRSAASAAAWAPRSTAGSPAASRAAQLLELRALQRRARTGPPARSRGPRPAKPDARHGRRVGQLADHPHDRRGVDRPAAALVVERHVAADHGHAQRQAGVAQPLDRARELPRDVRLLRVAEVEAVGEAERLGARRRRGCGRTRAPPRPRRCRDRRPRAARCRRSRPRARRCRRRWSSISTAASALPAGGARCASPTIGSYCSKTKRFEATLGEASSASSVSLGARVRARAARRGAG